MTFQDGINNEYFEWIFEMVGGTNYSKEMSYRHLLMRLHNTEFIYSIPMDGNRADDGVNLRYRFALDRGDPSLSDYIDGPCSVLEMMAALALRCEENIMDDPDIGNRMNQWFWGMIVNLGLGAMSDCRFDRRFVDDVLERFLNRDYEPDGRGGLFRIRHCEKDLRTVEIWRQLCWYLDSIVECEGGTGM